jgi:hypothetical protein
MANKTMAPCQNSGVFRDALPMIAKTQYVEDERERAEI